ncbi:MAG: PEP-utilizing enzyme [Sporichthyaceae bacterium]
MHAASYLRSDMVDDWDTLHSTSAEHLHWSTDNVGEAAPGVLTPLGWSLWGAVGERGVRNALFALGALDPAERRVPVEADERVVRAFHGRMAMQVEFLATIGNRMPGTTGEQITEGIFGRAPDDLDYTASRRRYPAIAAKLPVVALRSPAAVRRLAAQTDTWWRVRTRAVATAHREQATATLLDGTARFDHALTLHTTALMAVVQPTYDLLTKLVARTGAGDVAVLSGSGGAEMAVVADIWAASRGLRTLADVVAEHGFHGPAEGEVSSRVWREDDGPLRAMAEQYSAKPDEASPAAQQQRRAAAARASRAELLAAVPPWRRPQARAVLQLASSQIPLRGVGKRSFLQGIDVVRAAARRLGELDAAAGVLDDPADAFYLTVPELRDLPVNARELVSLRRERRASYCALDMPAHWTGNPVVSPRPVRDERARPDLITGVGASAGVVEGVVRVLHSPDFGDVGEGEVLVAPTTDPSWSSIMFISAALVVDIGSMLSHAAVVARELGLPAVVNTRTGTRDLRDGDRVRVDGAAGTVTVLQRAAITP